MPETSIAARLRRFLAHVRQGGTVRTTTYTMGEDGQLLQRNVAHRSRAAAFCDNWLGEPTEDVGDPEGGEGSDD